MDKLVEITTKDNLVLNGLLSSNNSDKLVIFVHGSSDNFYKSPFTKLMMKLFNENNYDFLSFNNRGHDFSVLINNKDGSYSTIGSYFEKISESYLDIDAVVKYAEELGYNQIYLLGRSLGCKKIILSYDKVNLKNRIDGIILIGPTENSLNGKPKYINEIKEQIKYAKELVKNKKGKELIKRVDSNKYFSAEAMIDYYDEELNVLSYSSNNKLEVYSKIDKRILVVIGENDPYFKTIKPNEVISRLKKENENTKGMVISNASHSLYNKREYGIKEIIKWLDKI